MIFNFIKVLTALAAFYFAITNPIETAIESWALMPFSIMFYLYWGKDLTEKKDEK